MSIFINQQDIDQPELLEQGPRELTAAIASLSIGGAERIVLDWATRIHPTWKLHLIVLRNRTKEWPVPPFVRLTRLQDQAHKKNDITDKLRELGRQIAQSGNPTCLCHLLKKNERDALVEGGAQVATVLHNAMDGWPEDAKCLAGSSQVIAVSDACSDDLRKSGWDGPISTIRHIPPRRQPDPDARNKFRREWNIPKDATVIGMIGAVKPQKNYLLALEVLRQLHQRRDAYLVILGGPVNTRQGRPAWESIVDAVHQLGLRNRVAMPGFIPNATRCLPAFDIMLNTSHYEGLSIATLEGLVHGIPVVASSVGGQGELKSRALMLIPKDAPPKDWASAIEHGLSLQQETPAWAGFPSYRLWTLASIARRFNPSRKVLFVTANLNSGGAQRSLVTLAKGLRNRMPFEITVLGASTTPYFHEELKKTNIRVTWAATPWNAFAFAENIVQKTCSEQIGTICFWNADARVKLLIAKTLDPSAVRLVDVSPGDYLYDEMDDTADFQELIAFSRAQYFRRKDSLVLKYHGPVPAGCEAKTVVIPNAISKPGRVKTDYAIRGVPRIAVNGRIAPTKFILEIISAMRLVWKDIPQAQLHFFGGAEPLHSEYAQHVQASGQDSRIFFHGVDFQARDLLPDFDAYVVLGKNQGCPNALMEALSVGIPSIGNDDGGTSEQIIDGQTGLLLKGTSPQELANAIARIISDRQLAKKLGETGRTHIARQFTTRRMAESYISVLAGRKPIIETFRTSIRQAINAIAHGRLYAPAETEGSPTAPGRASHRGTRQKHVIINLSKQEEKWT